MLFTSTCFHSIGFPSEWGRHTTVSIFKSKTTNECFHSIGFPSEWGPAKEQSVIFAAASFHSIGFPSEWGRRTVLRRIRCNVFPFNWFPQRVGTSSTLAKRCCEESFHSIGFPSEWGLTVLLYVLPVIKNVSIQLVSPASGDFRSAPFSRSIC